jgi:hypothetical protein
MYCFRACSEAVEATAMSGGLGCNRNVIPSAALGDARARMPERDPLSILQTYLVISGVRPNQVVSDAG